MKKGLLVMALLLSLRATHAQNVAIETVIRKMEDAEREATLKKDTAALRNIWSATFVVNAPNNQVVPATGNPFDRPVIRNTTYSSFTREIEHIQIQEGTVFSMGHETVVPGSNMPNAGQTIKRRYTNIWMKENGLWKLVARHANVICQ